MITINMEKAQAIAHGMRREMRAQEFAPLDQVIAAQIPGTDTASVEQERQAIRDKYAAMQAEIDAAQTADELKTALGVAA